MMRDVLQRFVKGAMQEILEAQIKASGAKTPKEPLVPMKRAVRAGTMSA